MRRMKHLSPITAVLATIFLLWACGSGGGGGDGDDGGAITPTNTIDSAKVSSLMTDISGIVPGCSMADNSLPTSTAALDSLSDLAREMADQIQGKFVAQSARAAAEPVVIDPIAGDCGGTLDIDLTADDVTNAFNGSLTFADFCFDLDGTQSTVSGGASFSGAIVTDAYDELQSLTLNGGTTGSGIQITSADFNGVFTLSGLKVSLGRTDTGFTLTVSLNQASATVTEGDDTETITVSDLVLTVSGQDSGGGSASIRGTVTTSDGTLLLSTPTTITVDAAGAITGGAIKILGAANTSVLITHSGTGYAFDVKADTDGNDSYDDEGDYSGTMDCTGIESELPI